MAERERTKAARPISADRQRVSQMRLWAMAVLTAVMVWAPMSSLSSGRARLSSGTVAQAAGVVAVLAVFGLRSLPVRHIVRGMAVVSGLLLARFGQLSAAEGLSGSWKVLLWLGAFAAALTFAPSSRSVIVDTGGSDEPGGGVGAGGVGADGSGDAGRGVGAGGSSSSERVRAMSIESSTKGRVPTAVAVAAVTLVGGFALLVGPRAANWFPVGASAGDLVDQSRNRADNVLASRETLDMTSRPRLSDRVVMTVRSPIKSFWRAELFDQWDGSSWSRSYGQRGQILTSNSTVASVGDVATERGVETTQVFRLESPFANVMPAAPSPVRVDASVGVGQRSDGTLVSVYGALGAGSSYTVHSRQMRLSAEVLRAAGSAEADAGGGAGGAGTGGAGAGGATGAGAGGATGGAGAGAGAGERAAVLAQFAQRPITSERVIAVASEQTRGLGNDFDRILALERWMSTHTTYSLDAPLSPAGVDVVDHFLFEQTEGWCEQIASSLVVMARAVGIPARLATGYAPGEWDSAGRRFVVRERDAHAWAEVWFQGQGWVPFDPTASVPLSGSDESAAGADARDWREVLGMVLVAVGIVSVGGGPVARMVQAMFARLRRRREQRLDAATRWQVRAEQRLVRLGSEAGVERRPSQSLTAYGLDLAGRLGRPEPAVVGELLDQTTYMASSDGAVGGGHDAVRGAGAEDAGGAGRQELDPQVSVESLLDDLEMGQRGSLPSASG